MDDRLAAELDAFSRTDEEYVRDLYRLVLRRDPDAEAQERALEKLAEGTLSRATLLSEFVGTAEHGRVRLLDDAIALALAARQQRRAAASPDGPALARRADRRGSLGARPPRHRQRARGRLRVRGAGLSRRPRAGRPRPARGCRPRRTRGSGDGTSGGGCAGASVRQGELRPGAARLDARARRRRQRALRPERRPSGRTARGPARDTTGVAAGRPAAGERARRRAGRLRLVPAGGWGGVGAAVRPGRLLRRGAGDLRADGSGLGARTLPFGPRASATASGDRPPRRCSAPS